MENFVENNTQSAQGLEVLDSMAADSLKISEAPTSQQPQNVVNNLQQHVSQQNNSNDTPDANPKNTNEGNKSGETINQNPTSQNNTPQQLSSNTQEPTPIEIDDDGLSSILSDATGGRIPNIDHVFQMAEENERLQQRIQELEQNPEALFKDPTQRSVYKFLSDFKGTDFDSGIQSYAKLKSLDIQNMNPEDALKERYILENSKYGLSREKSERMFQAEFDEKYGKYGEMAQDFIAKDGFEAKKHLAQMQSEFTTPKVDEQQEAQNQQQQEMFHKYEQAVQGTMDGFKSLSFDINGNPDNDFTFEVEDTKAVEQAMHDPQGFFNSRWTGSNGYNAEQMKVDIAILLNLEKVIEGISTYAINFGKEQAIRERSNIPNSNNPPASNAGQNNGIPKSWEDALMNATVRK